VHRTDFQVFFVLAVPDECKLAKVIMITSLLHSQLTLLCKAHVISKKWVIVVTFLLHRACGL